MAPQPETTSAFFDIPRYPLPEKTLVHPGYRDMKEKCDAWYLGYSTACSWYIQIFRHVLR